MTAQKVVDAFIRGELDRRDLITKLTAVGVSATAASAYALTLGRQGAAAAPGTSSTGIARYQDGAAEENYGSEFIFETIEEALQLIFDEINALLATLGALELFSAEDFSEAIEFDTLTRIAEQKQEHAEALAALLETSAADTYTPDSFDAVEPFLADLASEYDSLTALYAAVVPAIGDGAIRQTLMNAASVTNRHAALVNHFAGIESLPDTFEVPEL